MGGGARAGEIEGGDAQEQASRGVKRGERMERGGGLKDVGVLVGGVRRGGGKPMSAT